MESLIAGFLQLPQFVIYGLIGALAGALGALVTTPIKSKGARRFIPLLCAIVAINLARSYISDLRDKYGYIESMNEAMNALKEQRLFSVLIKYHPEAEDQLREGFKQILLTIPTDQVAAASQHLSAEVVNRFLEKHMITASNQSIYLMLKFNAQVLDTLQDPRDCVGYFLGTSVNPNALSADVIKEGSNLKANIIESSINNPSAPSKASHIEDVTTPLLQEYQRHGYSPDDLTKTQLVSTLPPVDGCRVATSFSNALASMDETQAAYVFKNLMLFGASEKMTITLVALRQRLAIPLFLTR